MKLATVPDLGQLVEATEALTGQDRVVEFLAEILKVQKETQRRQGSGIRKEAWTLSEVAEATGYGENSIRRLIKSSGFPPGRSANRGIVVGGYPDGRMRFLHRAGDGLDAGHLIKLTMELHLLFGPQ